MIAGPVPMRRGYSDSAQADRLLFYSFLPLKNERKRTQPSRVPDLLRTTPESGPRISLPTESAHYEVSADMIDSQTEQILTFAQAADGLPRRRQGRKTSIATLYRWSTPPGCRGVVLETIQIGGTRCTSREALSRFFEALTEGAQADRARGDTHRRPAGARTTAQRLRASAKAARELAETGA